MTETPVLDHVSMTVSDYARSKSFYTAALKPLSITLMMEFGKDVTGTSDQAGFGRGRPYFWIGSGKATGPIHVAFGAATRADVDAFYAAAMAAGGKDNGAPGVRAHYHPDYYGAFVLDPDGHNIEAVCKLRKAERWE
jgi:catechol 2,3-dioxygenase-like lactoylglutathione lyase family enzyme